MGQVSRVLRRGVGCYFHWCPACLELHPLPDGWEFDGNLESPTFKPSFKHTWNGHRTGLGEVNEVCHYVLTSGVLHFCGDCTHKLAGISEPLPELPERHRD